MADPSIQRFAKNLLYLDVTTLVVDEVPVDDARSLHARLDALTADPAEPPRGEKLSPTLDATSKEPASLAEIQRRLREISTAPSDAGARESSFSPDAKATSRHPTGLRERAPALLQATHALGGRSEALALTDNVSENELRAVMKIDHLVALGTSQVQIRTRMSLLGDVVTWVKRDADERVIEIHQRSLQHAAGWWGTLLDAALNAAGSLFKLLLK